MEGRLIVLFAALTVFVASGVQGTSHLSFANNTEVNIIRDGCGTTKLCLDEPTGCDPSTNAGCLFVSFAVTGVMAPNVLNLAVELRGNNTEPMGYVAMGFTNTLGFTTLFVCARNGSDNATFFRTGYLNNTNGMFQSAGIRVREIRIMAKDNVTRCEFDIPGAIATQTRNSITGTVTAGSGTLTADGGIGTFTPALNRTLNVDEVIAALGITVPASSQVNITRDGCGTTKLCLDKPTRCDPSTNTTCLFVSFAASAVMAPNGANLTVELRGDNPEPMGFVAMGLTNAQGSTMLFVCARDFFRTLMRNSDGMFKPAETTVTEIRLMAKDNVTRCEFNILHLNATQTRNSEDTTFTVTAGSGTLTADGGIDFTPALNRTLNIADPTANNAATTTAAPGNGTTTASSGAVHPHALLILLSVLTLFAMLRA